MKDERTHGILEKKHPYENFNKEVSSESSFVFNFSRLEENVNVRGNKLEETDIRYFFLLIIAKSRGNAMFFSLIY